MTRRECDALFAPHNRLADVAEDTMGAIEILKMARELIAEPAGWITERYATDADGRSVVVTADSAVRFCSLGAVDRAAYLAGQYSKQHRVRAEGALYRAARAVGALGVTRLNDTRTHREVLAMFDRAIESLERK